ncbi:response regulator transcription factor [Marivibrio halodurans]|uniref:Response regulator transcription factor n=1 Tax=Marivibrio halodurans TaxID=2039722 RepID=A0A8J7V3N4_9PROT|nr:response regulator transcription factor [Marivibrio halodurans]MBP5858570.1 response regulator transcription factor [Marivibrio halodurans]
MTLSEAHSTVTGDAKRRLAIVDDDPLFRESITQNLRDFGYRVTEFEEGLSFINWLSDAPDIDLLLLDWKMPRMNGIEVLAHVRKIAPELPVIFLTVLGDQIYEEAALLGGAVDFVEKSRSFSIILRRIQLIPATQPNGSADTGKSPSDTIEIGGLVLDTGSRRAYWNERRVDLTLSEFEMVHFLARDPGTDISYRDIYDVVRGEGFSAGFGEDGYRANVRSAIKRIRQKFRDIDVDFDQIENYPGFGYRWRPPE